MLRLRRLGVSPMLRNLAREQPRCSASWIGRPDQRTSRGVAYNGRLSGISCRPWTAPAHVGLRRSPGRR